MKIFNQILLIFAVILMSAANAEDQTDGMKETDREARARIAASLRALELPVTDVRETELDGFFEVMLDSNQVLFVTRDGRHFLTGDLYRLQSTSSGQGLSLVNVSEASRIERRKALMASVDPGDMVIFSPPEDKVKATISVFTDVDCGYCRKLHQEVPELNRLGIAVQYLAYPRAGVGSRSYDKIVSAWCADDPRKALTMAKSGQEIEARTCKNPVASQFRLGREIGVTGTPALVYEDGTLVPGYMPADQLAARLGVLN